MVVCPPLLLTGGDPRRQHPRARRCLEYPIVMDPRHRKLVELSIADTTDVLKISSSMVKGDLTAARVSLRAGAI